MVLFYRAVDALLFCRNSHINGIVIENGIGLYRDRANLEWKTMIISVEIIVVWNVPHRRVAQRVNAKHFHPAHEGETEL